jgi:hypothetical protein
LSSYAKFAGKDGQVHSGRWQNGNRFSRLHRSIVRRIGGVDVLACCIMLILTPSFYYRKNLILKDVVEERWVDSSVYSNTSSANIIVVKRNLSQAMIPGKRLAKVQVSQSLYEEHVAPVVPSVE